MTSANLTVETFVDASFGENAYVLSTTGRQGERVGWIIDPSFPPQTEHLLEYITNHSIRIERVILTHGHLDHIAGVDAVRQAHPHALVALAEAEQEALGNASANLSEYMGIPVTLQTCADEDLAPGAELTLGPLIWRVLDVSGHSPAGRAVYCAQAGTVFTGDALFAGSIGRTDFPGSDGRRLIRNIRENLYALPPETVVHSGHGPPTVIGNERKSNPFVADST